MITHWGWKFPLMRQVADEYVVTPGPVAEGQVVVWHDYNRGVVWTAPRWIAWLYRWLPSDAGWMPGPIKDEDGAYYRWYIGARRWQVGWVRRQLVFMWKGASGGWAVRFPPRPGSPSWKRYW